MTKIYDINGNEIKPKVQVTGYKLKKELPGVPIDTESSIIDGYFVFGKWHWEEDEIKSFPDFFEPIYALGKKVEFVKRAEYSTIANISHVELSEFDKIYYLGKKYQLDVFACYRMGSDLPYIYYGHLNDAIV